MNDNILGERLRLLRECANMSRAELSSQLNTSVSAISQYETGARVQSDDIKISIAKLFNVSLDYLMGLSAFRDDNEANTILNALAKLTTSEALEVIHFIEYLSSKHR